MKKDKMKKGFTLIEIMVSIAIIVILSSVLAISFSTYINRAKSASDIVSAQQDKYDVAAASVKNLKSYGPGTATQPPTQPPTPPPTALSGVSISGATQFGNTLSATVAPSGATANYAWSSSASAGGTYTGVGSGSTYTLGLADIGKFFIVTATGTGSYTGTVTSGSVGAVTTCPLTDVIVSSTKKNTDSKATVSPAVATVTYQWKSATSASGPWTNLDTDDTCKLVNSSGVCYQVDVTGTGGYSGTVSKSFTTANN